MSTVRRNGRTYSYGQIVESYRRESDGRPTVKVLLNLGALDEDEQQRWRAALSTARKGDGSHGSKVEADGATGPIVAAPDANLRYLDLAVLHRLWQQWGLGELLDECMPAGEQEVAPSTVVELLALQRCVEPTSKAAVPAWFARTALPELLGVAPDEINNTRLHRVLDQLAAATPALLRQLGSRYEQRQGRFVALFADVTDSWFVGEGPSLAESAQTKEGFYARKINIALMCNERGYPLHWLVEPGRRNDSVSMHTLVERVAQQSWARGVPIAMDRAMGKTAHVERLMATGCHFLTALTVDLFATFSAPSVYEPFANFELTDKLRAHRDDVARAVALAQQAGLQRVRDNLYVLDQGLRTVGEPHPDSTAAESAAAPAHSPGEQPTDFVAWAMQTAIRMQQAVADGFESSLQGAGRSMKLSRRQIDMYSKLLRLAPTLQQRVLAGEARCVSLGRLRTISALEDVELQRIEFDAACAEVAPQARPTRLGKPRKALPPSFQVRVTTSFNPESFVQSRIDAGLFLEEFYAFVAWLNTAAANPKSRKTAEQVLDDCRTKIKKMGLSDAIDLHVEHVQVDGRDRPQVRVSLREAVWAKRRRYDGFCVLVAHPDVRLTAAQMCTTYRDKNIVEADFRTIKSTIELRPFYHRLDEKIRAHVTVCMLSLLLERTLNHRLATSKSPHTAKSALAELEQARLNRFRIPKVRRPVYRLNTINESQAKVLRTLRMTDLANEEALLSNIEPR